MSIVSQAKVGVGFNGHSFAAFQQVKTAYLPVREAPEAHEAEEVRAEVRLSEPLLAKEHLRIHHVVVGREATEKSQERKIKFILKQSSPVVHQQEAPLLVKLNIRKRSARRGRRLLQRLKVARKRVPHSGPSESQNVAGA